jgi:hypothetical protein
VRVVNVGRDGPGEEQHSMTKNNEGDVRVEKQFSEKGLCDPRVRTQQFA